MRALTRLENKQNYGAIYTTYFYLPPKGLLKNNFTFSGVEAPACQGAGRMNSNKLFDRRITQADGMNISHADGATKTQLISYKAERRQTETCLDFKLYAPVSP